MKNKKIQLQIINIFILLIAILFISCPTPTNDDNGNNDNNNNNNNNNGGDGGGGDDDGDDGTFSVTSTAFNNGDPIPAKYAGNGDSPPLAISNLPAGTNSLVLWVLDEDSNTTVHWIVINVSVTNTTISEGETFTTAQTFANFRGSIGYFGPAPPSKHTYRYVVFALSDTTVPGSPPLNANQVQGHLHNFYSTNANKIGTVRTVNWNVLGTATLTGTYTPTP